MLYARTGHYPSRMRIFLSSHHQKGIIKRRNPFKGNVTRSSLLRQRSICRSSHNPILHSGGDEISCRISLSPQGLPRNRSDPGSSTLRSVHMDPIQRNARFAFLCRLADFRFVLTIKKKHGCAKKRSHAFSCFTFYSSSKRALNKK